MIFLTRSAMAGALVRPGDSIPAAWMKPKSELSSTIKSSLSEAGRIPEKTRIKEASDNEGILCLACSKIDFKAE